MIKPETVLYFAGATLSFLRDIASGKSNLSLGDSIDKLLSNARNQLASVPVRKNVHEVQTIGDRIGHIRLLIRKHRYDPRLREIAMKVLTQKNKDGSWKVREKDWVGEVRELFRFVRRHARYARDPWGMDTYASPMRTLAFYKGGDCDDMTILLGALLQSVGYPIRLKIIQTPPNETYNHIYLLVGIPPTNPVKWIAADPAATGKPLGFQVPKSLIIRQKIYEV